MVHKKVILASLVLSLLALIGLTACDTIKATYCTTIVPALNKTCQATAPVALLTDKTK